jgi:hypothetical protein
MAGVVFTTLAPLRARSSRESREDDGPGAEQALAIRTRPAVGVVIDPEQAAGPDPAQRDTPLAPAPAAWGKPKKKRKKPNPIPPAKVLPPPEFLSPTLRAALDVIGPVRRCFNS